MDLGSEIADATSPLLHPIGHTNLPDHDIDDLDIHVEESLSWRRRLKQLLIVSLAWFLDAQQTFVSVFTDAQPTWRCLSPPLTSSTSCETRDSPCDLPSDVTWTWERPKSSTIISDFDLQCSTAALQSLPSTSFFAGCLAGGFALSTLADGRLGRKNTLLLSLLIMSLSGVLAAASPDVWAYSALRFSAGFGRSTINGCALVLATEVVGERWRREAGVVCYVGFSIGFLSLPGVAYLTREFSWRTMYIFISLPSLLYTILIPFLIYESPRWLLLHGRTEEAIKVLKGDDQDYNVVESAVLHVAENKKKDAIKDERSSSSSLFATLKIIWERKWALKRLASIMAVAIGVGLGYYGMPLGVQNLGLNPYLSVAINAVVEFPSSLATYFVTRNLKRRSSMIFFTSLSAALSLLIYCIDLFPTSVVVVVGGGGAWQTAMEVVAFFSICTAFDVMLIYCMELFPTSVRNSAVCMARQAAVIGSGIAPALVSSDGSSPSSSYGVFGVVIAISGAFAVFLPETRGGAFCDTMEEEEGKVNTTQ